MSKKWEARQLHDIRSAFSSLYGLIEMLRLETIDFRSEAGNVALSEAENSIKLLEKTFLEKNEAKSN